jgi:nitroimidazol reductase NimA-like FMN-containing flavoprotein (pyridoxamine 5'-phosphate oxidase superfamily)
MLIEDLNKQECGEVLKRLGFGRLSCASKNQPYVVPIYFAYEPNHIFGFSTVGQKIEWMRKNPRVCVEADEVIGQDNWTSVLVFGRYEELPDCRYRKCYPTRTPLKSATCEIVRRPQQTGM